MTDILYVSTMCSENVLQYIFETANQKPEQAAQKFHRLLTKGLAMHPDCRVTALTTIPVTPSLHNRKFWILKQEENSGVCLRYIPMVNLKGFKNLGVFLYTFFYVLWWTFPTRRHKKRVICDVLFATVAAASQWACKLTGAKCYGIVTDIPGMMVTNIKEDANRFFVMVYQKTITKVLKKFSGYILLTKQMNPVVNPGNKPYMIMEGLVDLDMNQNENRLEEKEKEKILIYAGGLYEKYGIKKLIEAFQGVRDPDVRLHLYGNGPMAEQMDAYMKNEPRLKYLGMVPNDLVVSEQLKATLLINPRPTAEAFTRFSFPSKNMEYMVSGTPMITTDLPGMPEEYRRYVYLFKDETVEGMRKSLESVISSKREELHTFGAKARTFVLKQKNNKIQAARVLQFVSQTE